MSTSADTAKDGKRLRPRPAASRTIAACQRCRAKKVRCDQALPQCLRCLKAGHDCTLIDPATGREVARSHVQHLEARVAEFEARMLQSHVLELEARVAELEARLARGDERAPGTHTESPPPPPPAFARAPFAHHDTPRYYGPALGVSFARMMTAALKLNPPPPPRAEDASAVSAAVLPPKHTAQEFIRIYFSQSNAQMPVLHREEFLAAVFAPIYGPWDDQHAPPAHEPWFPQYKQLLGEALGRRTNGDDGETGAPRAAATGVPVGAAAANGAAIAAATPNMSSTGSVSSSTPTPRARAGNGSAKGADGAVHAAAEAARIKVPARLRRPLYFLFMVLAIASSANHLQYPTTISAQFRAAALPYAHSFHDPLEHLESVLLMAVYATMRPCVPGVWYVLGTALRLCVDLGLHTQQRAAPSPDAFTADRGRRLFWCTYSLDRQICFYLGRPVGIPDEAISAPFPSPLDDACIVRNGATNPVPLTPASETHSPDKTVAIAMFRMRQLQLEVQRVIYDNTDVPRQFSSLDEWKNHITNELFQWHSSAPTAAARKCDFNTEYFSLNFHHTLLLLNGLLPRTFHLSHDAYHVVAVALQNVVAVYARLHARKAINYTWAAVYNLFNAGTTYLFALYTCESVRRAASRAAVERTAHDCAMVLALLTASCTAAQSCRDTFQVLTAAVLRLCYSDSEGGDCPTHELSPSHELSYGAGGDTAATPYTPAPAGAEGAGTSAGIASAGVLGLYPDTPQDFAPALDGPLWAGDTTPDLNSFFKEVANLSPSTTGVSPNVSAEPDLPREGRRVFELIQQPVESIWDQFFTLAKAGVDEEVAG